MDAVVGVLALDDAVCAIVMVLPEIKPDTVQSVSDIVLGLPEGTRFYVTFPLRFSDKVTHDVVIENLRAQGFLREFFVCP